jgi:hypothetical protein
MLLVLLLTPMKLWQASGLFYVTEIMSAYSCLDVCQFILIGLVFELQGFADALNDAVPIPEAVAPIVDERGGVFALKLTVNAWWFVLVICSSLLAVTDFEV